MNDKIINSPLIEIKFGNCSQTNEQILSVYVKTFHDAIKAANGDVDALENLLRLSKEATWMIDGLLYQSINGKVVQS